MKPSEAKANVGLLHARRRNRRMLALGTGALLAVGSFIPVGGKASPAIGPRVSGVDLSRYSAAGPTTKTDLLFIHHSCGGQWLAGVGRVDGDDERCIYGRHPNGGNLRARLEATGYVVHEASYGSVLGDHTDMFDWLPKFREHMDEISTHQVVVFKSCFTNSEFVGPGTMPGDPAGPKLTVANAKATMSLLLAELRKRPDVLFVYVTAPPLAGDESTPAWRALARVIKHGFRALPRDESGALARVFDDWMKSPDGWLKDYPYANVVVFDYFDVLTGDGKQNVAAYPSHGADSHPSSAGNEKATEAFVPFMNRALHRLELAQGSAHASGP